MSNNGLETFRNFEMRVLKVRNSIQLKDIGDKLLQRNLHGTTIVWRGNLGA